jgi:hypothetical protein
MKERIPLYAEVRKRLPRASCQHIAIRLLGKSAAGLCCPHCGSIIYSRRHKVCGVCAQELPAELLFPEEEAQRLQFLMQFERLQHRTWMAKG